jgi:hypothetical protein
MAHPVTEGVMKTSRYSDEQIVRILRWLFSLRYEERMPPKNAPVIEATCTLPESVPPETIDRFWRSGDGQQRRIGLQSPKASG